MATPLTRAPGAGRSGPALLRDPLLLGAALIPIVISVHVLRYLMRLGDEGIIPHVAVRILSGQVIYRDFFEFLSPGGFLLVAVWMKTAPHRSHRRTKAGLREPGLARS